MRLRGSKQSHCLQQHCRQSSLSAAALAGAANSVAAVCCQQLTDPSQPVMACRYQREYASRTGGRTDGCAVFWCVLQ